MQTLTLYIVQRYKRQGEFWQKMESYKNNQMETLEMKDTITEIKNLMDRSNS